MPATITPIKATRTFAVKPAQGLRYGNFDGVRNLPPLRHKEYKKENNLGLINNEQICRRVCQWMESWQPWQTRTLLCGISNRFTVSQLEILATTLEPLRHRDYKTCTLSRYPSASLRVQKSSSPNGKKRTGVTKSEKSVNVTIPSTAADEEIKVSTVTNDAESKFKNTERKKKVERKEILHDENNNSNSQMKSTVGDEEIKGSLINEGINQNIDDYASVLSSSILKSALNEANHVLFFDKAQFSASREPSYEKEDNKENMESVEKESDSNKSNERKISLKLKPNEIEKSEGSENGLENQECSKSLVFDKLFQKSQKSATSGRKSHPQSSRTSSARFLGGVLEFASNPYNHKECIRTQSTSSQYRYSTFASSVVSTNDFFNRDKISIFGTMQQTAAPGAGPSPKPMGVDLAPISLQKCYKHQRWWPSQAPAGKTYRHPQRRELANNFKEQLQTIWGWLNDWEGYERITFVKEVLKVCSAEILDSLMTHIHQRLKDARDVNRLPDQLLLYILSFLPLHDILRSAKVCRRWRYLCATDDLWILKCLEVGEEAGISNLPELIEEAKKKGTHVDWMLAHFELNKLATSLNLEWALDDLTDRSSEQFLKYDRVWTGIIRPIAGQLSASKEKLDTTDKKGKVRIQFNTGVKERLEQAEKTRKSSQGLEGGDASDTDSAFSEEDLSHLMSEYNMMPEPSGSSTGPKWSKSRKRTESFKLSVPDIVREENTPATSSANRMTRSSKRSSATSSKKKKEEDVKDVALDIRTDLTQSHDILGKMKSYSSLEWESADTYNDYMRTTLHAGALVGVKRMRKLQGHTSAINCVYFDKRRLVTCGLDRVVRLWDVRSGRFLHEFIGHKGGIRCLQFDNDIMATGSWDCLVLIWDMKKFRQIATLQGHSDSVTCLQFDGDLLISGSDDRSVRLWRRPTFDCMLTIQFESSVRSLIIVDHLFIVSTADLTTEMIDVYTGTRRRKFEPPLSPIQCLVATGQLLVGGDEYGRACFWNISTGEMEAAVKVHDACVNQLAYHDGRFFTASDDTTIKEWDLRTMTCLRVLKGHRGPVRDVRVSDRRIVSCSDDTTVRIWDLVLDKTKVVANSKTKGGQ